MSEGDQKSDQQGQDQLVVKNLRDLYHDCLTWRSLSRCENLLAHTKAALPEYGILPHEAALTLKILIEHAIAHAATLARQSGDANKRAVNCKAIPFLIGLIDRPAQLKGIRDSQAAEATNVSPGTVRRYIKAGTYFNSLIEAINELLSDSKEREKFIKSAGLKRIFIAKDSIQETNELTTDKPEDEQSDIAILDSSDSISARLRNLSARLAAELDVSSSQGVDDELHRLSGGLYVRRLKQDVVLDRLRTDRYDLPVIVSGLAGEGKSSLLWGVYRELSKDDRLESFLVDSLWLVASDGQEPPLTRNELQEAAAYVRSCDKIPIFLIDTVDLLLHHPVHRQHLLDICDDLGDVGARVVITSRPDEVRRIPTALFHRVELEPYHEKFELPQAVKQHVAIFCPEAAPLPFEAKVQSIIKAAVNGLPVKEVILNPLKFRLLFELYGEEFAPLDELDAARLNTAYWQRRVITDQRSEVTLVSGEDLSRPAEQIAIALLAGGRPSSGERQLVESAASVADDWNGELVSSKDKKRLSEFDRVSLCLVSAVFLYDRYSNTNCPFASIIKLRLSTPLRLACSLGIED